MNNTNTTNNAGNADNAAVNSMMTEADIKEKYLKLNTTKLQLAKIAAVLMIIAALFISWHGYDLKSSVKNPSKTVYDNVPVLSDGTLKAIESRNAAFYELTGDKNARIFVVVEKDRSSYNDLQKKADKLFKDYKVGDNGILFVVTIYESNGWLDDILDSIDDLVGGGTQRYAYHKGRNLNELKDGQIINIFRNNLVNGGEYKYKPDNYDDAILNTFNVLADNFDLIYGTDSKNYKHIEIPADETDEPSSAVFPVILGVIILLGGLLVILGILTKRANPGVSKVYKRPFWFGMI